MISGKFRNKNAARVATPEQVAWLTKFLEHHTNLDGQEVADYYNTVCEAFGSKIAHLYPAAFADLFLFGLGLQEFSPASVEYGG